MSTTAVPAFKFTRQHAKMIAEELYKLTHTDIKSAVNDVVREETEEFLTTKEAAMLIGISVGRLYQTKDVYGCYTKINGSLRFAKNLLIRTIKSGGRKQ